MREDGGLTEIEKSIDKLSRHHIRHIKAYDPNEGKFNPFFPDFVSLFKKGFLSKRGGFFGLFCLVRYVMKTIVDDRIESALRNFFSYIYFTLKIDINTWDRKISLNVYMRLLKILQCIYLCNVYFHFSSLLFI